MQTGRGMGMGLYYASEAQKRQERARLAAQQKVRELNLEISEQKKLIDQWLQDEKNQNVSYITEVRKANQLLSAEVESFQYYPAVDDLQSRLDDLKALNAALKDEDTHDLIERAKVHMTCASPVALGLGVTLAAIGVGILIASAFVVCPALVIVGLAALVGGFVCAELGGMKSPTERAYTFFNVAKGIEPEVDEERDLYEIDAITRHRFSLVSPL